MPSIMADSDQLAILSLPMFASCRVATYADLITPEFIASTRGRLTVIDRGRGDPHNLATVVDIEPGAYSPQTGAAKCRDMVHAGKQQVTPYHDRSSTEAVLAELAGLALHHWIATLDGTLLVHGVDDAVVQFAGAAVTGVHADFSIVWSDSWHPLPAVSMAGVRSHLHDVAMGLQPPLKSLFDAIDALPQ